jgi:uncharacterized protein (TIGR02996 family)
MADILAPGAAMSDEKALLAAIWDEPQEDTPRLVYADWLQENDQADRAEFIRVQIERARLTDWDSRSSELDARERELTQLNWQRWYGDLPVKHRAGFHRGFPLGRIQASGSRFAATPASVLSLAPLWHLHSTQLARGWTKAVASPSFLRVGEINASFVGFPGCRIQRFADSANARNVKRLQLQYCDIGDSGGVAIARSPHLRHLDKLGLGANKLTDATAVALSAAVFASTIRELDLGGSTFGPEGIRALASGQFTNLLDLDLAGCRSLGDGGIHELTRGLGFPRLRYLALRYVGMSDIGLLELAEWAGMSGVNSLDISGNKITAASLTALLGSPHLAAVRGCQINVSETPLEKEPRVRTQLRERFHHVVFDPSLPE